MIFEELILFFILVFLDLIFGFLLIYCFVHKLFYLVIQQKESLSSLNAENQNKNELSQKELGYVRLATKYALLCSIAIIFTNLQFAGWALYFVTLESNENYWLQMILNWSYNLVL